MPTYVIVFDLVGPTSRYAEMIKRLRNLEPGQAIETLLENVRTYPDSTYILNAATSKAEILEVLRQPGGLGDNDKVLIAGVEGEITTHP